MGKKTKFNSLIQWKKNKIHHLNTVVAQILEKSITYLFVCILKALLKYKKINVMA